MLDAPTELQFDQPRLEHYRGADILLLFLSAVVVRHTELVGTRKYLVGYLAGAAIARGADDRPATDAKADHSTIREIAKMILQLNHRLDGLEYKWCADVVLLFLSSAIEAHPVFENTGEMLVVQRSLAIIPGRADDRPAASACSDNPAVGQVAGAVFQLDNNLLGLEIKDRVNGSVLHRAGLAATVVGGIHSNPHIPQQAIVKVDQHAIGVGRTDDGPAANTKVGCPTSHSVSTAILQPDDQDAMLYFTTADRQGRLILAIEQEVKVAGEEVLW